MNKTLILLLSSLLLFACCKSDDNMPAPIDQLPPATQTGEVIFACLVNGEPYICKGYDMVTAYYQWVDGGRVFIVRGLKETNTMWSVAIGNRGDAPITQEQNYLLNGNNPGYFFGGVCNWRYKQYLRRLINKLYLHRRNDHYPV